VRKLSDNKNIRKTVWLYAVILFTSAFVVLLLTYYSQLRTDKSISDYLDRLSKEEKKSLLYQTNLNSALEEKNNLNKEVENLKKQLNTEKNKYQSYKDDMDKIKKNYLDTMNSYDQLLYAENEYNKGNYVKSADILLNNCDNNFLNSIGKEIYNRLTQDAFDKAAKSLYIEGYKFYKDKLYAEAIQKFSQSLNFSKHNYLSDDCYYLRAYSFLKLGDNIKARKDFEELLNNYKDSGYIKDIERLLKALN
jgi:tetratricopeptide (TPR) repeat protein